MIILLECIDCRYCNLQDGMPVCIHQDFPIDKTHEFLPIGTDDAECCNGFSERLISFDKDIISGIRYTLRN